MTGEELIEQVKAGYEAFGRGDVESAIDLFADDIEWTNPGNSAISGTFNGKDQVLEMWGRLESFSVDPKFFTADADHVVVISDNSAAGEQWESADVFTFEGGKVKSFQGIEDPEAVERAFPA